MLRKASPIKPIDLEKILNVLPILHSVDISLFGKFGYSIVSDQIERLVSGIKLPNVYIS